MATQAYLDDKTIMDVVSGCLTTRECEKLCTECLGVDDVMFDRAKFESDGADGLKFHMVKQWLQQTGERLTADQLAEYLVWMELPKFRLNKAMRLLGLSK